jgi:hypothetical protein
LRVHPILQKVDPWTFAGPEAELKMIETGFAAVGRAALPSFFPHVFRWKLEPPPNTSMLCGAVVPMYAYGQKIETVEKTVICPFRAWPRRIALVTICAVVKSRIGWRGGRMDWARILAFATGLVDQELLARHEYLAAENRILKAQLKRRLKLSDAERAILGEIGHRRRA